MFTSIRSKIMALWLILIITVLLFSGFTLQRRMREHLIERIENNLTKEARLVRDLIKDEVTINNYDIEVIERLLNKYSNDIDARITIIRADGKVLGDSEENPRQMPNHLNRPEIQEALQSDRGISTRYSKTLQQKMKYVALPITKEVGEVGVVRLAISLTQIRNLLFDIFWRLSSTGLVAIFLSLILGLKLIKRITNPIERMTEVASRMAEGSLDERLNFNYKDELGRLSRAFNNMADELEAKINEISQKKKRIEAIVTGMGDGLIAVDQSGRVILFNPAAEYLFQINEQKTLDKSVLEVTRNHKLHQILMSAVEEDQDRTEEIETIYPEQKNIRVHVTPIQSKEDGQEGAVAVLRDITEVRKLEQMRTEFVGNVSHELKTPLTSIKGYVETLLVEDDLEPSILDNFLEIIKDEADRLEQLITDLLDLSQLESNVSALDQGNTVDLNQVVEKVLTTIVPKADSKQIDLKVDTPAQISPVRGNRSQIERLYINLVDNAIKYTPEGGQVQVKIYEEQDKVWTKIIDDGIGIPEEDLARIFERFYRVDKTRSRKLGGTGLGLSIVKHILENHQGEIEVESEVDEGTKFTFYLLKAD
ncbi:MAG: two-component system histidine kinase PnpS [Bacillota bacterium]